MREALLADQIAETLGPTDFAVARYENLNRLADRMTAEHWHVNDLPWDELPLLPIPPGVDARRRRAFVEFGKRAIDVQLAAEHVAVEAAHLLLQHAERSGMHSGVCRALAAVLNDESSHVAVMLELSVRTAKCYPGVEVASQASPLFMAFVEALPLLHPALISIFMGAYEAMIAIRSYAEEASYRYPSILGRIATLAARDDAHHAKVMRLVGHVLLDELRGTLPGAAELTAAMQERVVFPMRAFWPLVIEHERFLLRGDTRFHQEWRRRVLADAAIVQRLFCVIGLTDAEQSQVDLLGAAAACLGPGSVREKVQQ